MNDNTITLIVAIIIPVILSALANGAAWLLMRPQKGKLKAETAQLITEAAGTLVEDLTARVDELKESGKESQILIAALKESDAQNQILLGELRTADKEKTKLIAALKERVSVLEHESLELRKGGILLEDQIEELGGDPVWRVPGRRVA